MPSLIERLAEIRQLQGREPIDGSRIEGAPGPTPPPPIFEPATVTEPDEFEELAEPETHMSPLVAAAQPKPETAKEFIARHPEFERIPNPPLELCVFDTEAAFQGRGVNLTEMEKRQVTGIVLRALQRVVREQLASLVKLTPKRARRALKALNARTVAPATASESPEPVRKKRGRPRGSLLGKKS